jgi:transketolase
MAVGTKTGATLDEAWLADLAGQLRVDAIRAAGSAGSGHPSSSLSAADLLAVLLARHLRYDWWAPDNPNNDHLIFSKGHASPLLYATFKAAGVVSDDELVNTYRRFGSRLQGHPTPAVPWVEVATGWPAGTSTICRSTSGHCAATARWPRARSGRRWTRRRTTGWPTSRYWST